MPYTYNATMAYNQMMDVLTSYAEITNFTRMKLVKFPTSVSVLYRVSMLGRISSQIMDKLSQANPNLSPVGMHSAQYRVIGMTLPDNIQLQIMFPPEVLFAENLDRDCSAKNFDVFATFVVPKDVYIKYSQSTVWGVIFPALEEDRITGSSKEYPSPVDSCNREIAQLQSMLAQLHDTPGQDQFEEFDDPEDDYYEENIRGEISEIHKYMSAVAAALTQIKETVDELKLNLHPGHPIPNSEVRLGVLNDDLSVPDSKPTEQTEFIRELSGKLVQDIDYKLLREFAQLHRVPPHVRHKIYTKFIELIHDYTK